MKKIAICLTMALTLAACVGGCGKSGGKAEQMIDEAYRAKNYQLLMTLADSLQQAGELSDAKAYYWQGYASDRMKQFRTAEFYWKSAVAAAENSTDAEDLALYAKSASRLANGLSVRGDYASTLKAAEPVLARLEALGCDTTSDYTNLLIFVGCCKTRFGLPDSTANKYYDRAYEMHKAFIENAHSDESYKNAIAGLINIAYNCNGTQHYDDALLWTDNFGKIISEYEMRQGDRSDYVDKQWARYNIYRAIALEGLGRHEEADSVYRDYLHTQFAQTPEGHIDGADYLIAANRWSEAADAYRSLDDMIKDQQMVLSLENIHNYGLKKFRTNVMAERRDSANAVASYICELLDSAVTQSRRLDAEEQQTIRDKEAMIMAKQNEVTHQRMIASLIAFFVVLAAFIGYILYRRRQMSRLESAHEELKSNIDQVEVKAQTKERVENKQRIARNIQMKLMPTAYPESNDVSLYAQLMHGSETSGDLYDYYIRDEKLYFCIGEAKGTDIPAAVATAMVKTLFRSVSAYESQPERIVAAINKAMTEDGDAPLPVALFTGVLDLTTGRMKYSNAGHDAPLLVGSGIGLLPVDVNAPLGEQKDATFTGQETLIDPGSVIFLYNDGLIAAEDASHQQFGKKRMMGEALQTLHGLDPAPQAFTERMIEAVNKFTGGAAQRDDMAMLAIRYTRKAEGVSYQRSVSLSNETNEVLRMNNFIEKVCKDLHVKKSVADEIGQTMEEAMVNLLKYGFAEGVKGNIHIEVSADEKMLKFVMRDNGQPIDAASRLSQPAAVDAVSYEVGADQNVLTLCSSRR